MKETINFRKKKFPILYLPVPRGRSVRSYLVGSLIISICLVILWMLRLGDMQSKSLRASIGTTKLLSAQLNPMIGLYTHWMSLTTA